MKPILKLVAFGVLLIASAGIVASVFKQCRKPVKQVADIMYNRADSTVFYRDMYNTEHAQRRAEVASKDVIIAILGKKGDSLASRIGIKKKQLQNVTSVQAQASGTFTAGVDTVYYPDTADDGAITHRPTGLKFTYNDAWISQTGTIDSIAHVDYTVYIPITLTQYWKRKNKFLGIPCGPKQYFIDGYSDNPNAKIMNLSNQQVAVSRPKLWHYLAVFGAGLVTGAIVRK